MSLREREEIQTLLSGEGSSAAADVFAGGGADMAALAVASGLCVPFPGDYDLVVCGVAGAWIGGEAGRTGKRLGGRFYMP